MIALPNSGAAASRLAIGVCALALGGTLAVVAASFLTPSPELRPPFLVGVAGEFDPASVTYFEEEHFFLVRYQSGEFRAFYDLDPRQQTAPYDRSRPQACRLEWHASGFGGVYGETPREPGLEEGVFREPCFQVTYSVRGERLFGPSNARLDEFPVSVSGDLVHVDLSDRQCGRFDQGGARRNCGWHRSP